MTLDEIKQLMAAGETAQAEEALKELLANEPDNLQAKMLYGTCRQLLGGETARHLPAVARLSRRTPRDRHPRERRRAAVPVARRAIRGGQPSESSARRDLA